MFTHLKAYLMQRNYTFYISKSHVAPHFECFKIRNVKMPFTMLLTSCDVNTSAIDMT